MQGNLESNRWLGPILEVRESVDFTNYEKGIIVLREVLRGLMDSKEEPVEEWSVEKVKKWLVDKKISHSLYNDIYPVYGKILGLNPSLRSELLYSL